ncbi:hypothetical protein GCM10010399_82110 [Dactylosporangium fulvum]
MARTVLPDLNGAPAVTSQAAAAAFAEAEAADAADAGVPDTNAPANASAEMSSDARRNLSIRTDMLLHSFARFDRWAADVVRSAAACPTLYRRAGFGLPADAFGTVPDRADPVPCQNLRMGCELRSCLAANDHLMVFRLER